MRICNYFCNNEPVGKLLSQFPISQGPLFHYIDQTASIGIRRGEVWMTRADCFLDESEITHGLEVLFEAAKISLVTEEIESFSRVLNELRARLQACFILSVSQDPDSEHLRSVYAGQNGDILEFQENLPMMFYGASWHTIPNRDGSSRIHLIADLYEFFEGSVVYDRARQLQLAKMACQSYHHLRCTDAHPSDIYHFVDILIRCIVLFKATEFEVEKEYRFALVRNRDGKQSFEEIMDRAGKSCAYIRVVIPSSDAPKIHVRNAQP